MPKTAYAANILFFARALEKRMKMRDSYRISIAGIERDLPLCKVGEDLYIAAFIMFGDVEATQVFASELLKKAPEHDIMITAESKGIPLIYEMARQSGQNDYIVARKGPKLYMKDIVYTHVNSITTETEQILCVGSREVELIRGRRVLIVDDVISTGESIAAVEKLIKLVGGTVAGKMAVLAEGDAINRDDIIYLEKLPLFHADGSEIL